MKSLALIQKEIIFCTKCERLVKWREQVAVEKRASYRDQDYWGKPIPGFGDSAARLIICGLAPAAHGANRTGRVFTGDRSGDWLFSALHRAGFANQSESIHSDDGLTLTDCYITMCVRCAPPDNKPTTEERDHCLPYLARELIQLPNAMVILCLGSFAWSGALKVLRMSGEVPRPLPRFGHGATVKVQDFVLLGSYHPSQQNTFTGRLTTEMLDDVFRTASSLIA